MENRNVGLLKKKKKNDSEITSAWVGVSGLEMSGACPLADCWRSIDFNEGFYLSCSTRFPSNRRTQSRTSTVGISAICTFFYSAFYSSVILLEDNKSPRFNVTCTHNQFYKFFHTSSPPCNRVIHGHYRVVNVNSRQSSWSCATFA